jgi:hypothetical protein
MSLILDGTNGLSDVDGSAATPAIRGSDANTGVFFGADIIGFAEGGAEVARFDASGNFLVGQTTPVTSGRGVTVNGSQQSFIVRNGVSDYNEIGVWAGASNDVKGQLVAVTPDNKVLVGSRTNHPLAFNVNDTECARIDTSGNLLVGTTSALGKITSSATFSNGSNWDTTAALSTTGAFGGGLVMVDGSGGYGLYCADSGNDFYIQGSNSLSSALTGGVYLNDRATSWSSASDERLKTIIEPITDAITKVCQLRTVIGRYNYEAEDKRHPFLIAQDVQAVLPEAVSVADKQSEEQYLGVSYTDIIPLLVAAIKEQQAIITALTARVEALEGAQA